MSNSFGKKFKITTFGESHGPAIGVLIEGVPAGTRINFDGIRYELDRRRPGKSSLESQRKEDDDFEFISGILNGRATGSPLTVLIKNKDYKRSDYENIKAKPRPSHADYPVYVKYKGFNDPSGSGQFSGRLTAPLVLAGAIAKDILKDQGIEIVSRIKKIYMTEDIPLDYGKVSYDDFEFSDKYFPVLDQKAMDKMKNAIEEAKNEKDSLGGTIESFVFGLPVGVGQPLYDSIESRIASAIFSIPGVRGIEFGTGFAATEMKGSLHNDEYYLEKDRIRTRTNNHGGAIGGLSSGMPLIFTTAIKPTPSIGLVQNTVDLEKSEDTKIELKGRHDPCIVPRCVPVVDAWTGLCLIDLMMIGGFI